MENELINQKQNRRRFISTLSLLGIATVAPIPLVMAAKKNEGIENFTILNIGPYLQSPYPNKITVRWVTNTPCHSWVEYGQRKDQLDKTVETINNGLIEANNKINGITINDLKPGKKYFYRICSKQVNDFQPYKVTFGNTFKSKTYSFETPSLKSEQISFLVFNDIHDHPQSFKHLMQFQGEDKKDFVLLNGDMFDYLIDENQIITNLLKPLTELFSTTTPFILANGNHETRGKFSRQLSNYINGDESKYYFSFQQGPMYAIILDSGEDKEDTASVYAGLVDFDNYRVQQGEWLKKEVQKESFKKAKFKVVFSHIPLYYSGDGHGTLHCRDTWGSILNDAKIDVLISGHTHRYGIHTPKQGQHNYPIVIGGGPREGTRTIIKVKADNETFNLDMLNDQGVSVGNLTI